MKQTNLTLYFLCILCASFILFKCRASYGYAVPAIDPIIAADDYYQLRQPLRVIEGGRIDPAKAKPLFYTPAGMSSSLPLAGLVGGAAGIAGLAYYQRTGVDPVYAAANAVASAADHIFVPAYQAFKDAFVSPESFPAAAAQYVGVEGSIGATVGDIVDFVQDSGATSYSAFKALLADNTDTVNPSHTGVYSGAVINLSDSQKYLVTSPITRSAIVKSAAETAYNSRPHIQMANGAYGWLHTTGTEFYFVTGELYTSVQTVLALYMCHVNSTQSPASLFPQSAPNYSSLKNALQNPSPAVAAEIKEAINDLPDAQKGVSSNPAPSSAPAQVQPAINQQQVQNFYAQNASSVANYNTTNITDNSTSTQIAQGQAATEAAQAKAAEKIPDATFKGDAALPDANEYDPEFEQPEEQNFVDKVHSFINSGLPVISSIRASHLTASGSPRMSTTIWGNAVDIDFSNQQTVLRAAGAVLVTISLILSYLVIVRS